MKFVTFDGKLDGEGQSENKAGYTSFDGELDEVTEQLSVGAFKQKSAASRIAKGLGLDGGDYDESSMGGQMITPAEAAQNSKEYAKQEQAEFDKKYAQRVREQALKVRGFAPEDAAAIGDSVSLSEDELKAASKRLGYEGMNRNVQQIAGDLSLSGVAGVKQLAKAGVDLVAPASETAQYLNESIAETNSRMSPEMREQLEWYRQQIKDAESQGRGAEFVEAFGNLSPQLAAHYAANTLPSMAPVFAAGKVAQGLATARGATAAGAALAGARGAGVANAALNAGGARGDTFEELKQTYMDKGASEDQAIDLALSDSWIPAGVGAATGYVGGRFGAESDIIRDSVTTAAKFGLLPALKAVLGSLGRELTTEQAEELLPKITTNLLAEKDPLDGIAEISAQTFAGSAGMGSVGAASAGRAAYQTPLERELQGFADAVDGTSFNPAGATAEARRAAAGIQPLSLSDMAELQARSNQPKAPNPAAGPTTGTDVAADEDGDVVAPVPPEVSGQPPRADIDQDELLNQINALTQPPEIEQQPNSPLTNAANQAQGVQQAAELAQIRQELVNAVTSTGEQNASESEQVAQEAAQANDAQAEIEQSAAPAGEVSALEGRPQMESLVDLVKQRAADAGAGTDLRTFAAEIDDLVTANADALADEVIANATEYELKTARRWIEGGNTEGVAGLVVPLTLPQANRLVKNKAFMERLLSKIQQQPTAGAAQPAPATQQQTAPVSKPIRERETPQLIQLAKHGLPGKKEEAIAELARRGIPFAPQSGSEPQKKQTKAEAKKAAKEMFDGAALDARRKEVAPDSNALSAFAESGKEAEFLSLLNRRKEDKSSLSEDEENRFFDLRTERNNALAAVENAASQKPQLDDTNVADLNQVPDSQIETKQEEAKPAQGSSAVKSNLSPIQRRDDLVGAIMRVTGGSGISSGMAQTIVGDTANNATKVRGLFTNAGVMDLDDTADLLRNEEGYDVRDGNHLAELIREQAAGNPVYSSARIEREAAKDAEKKHREEVLRRAKKYGVRHVARPFSETEDEVFRIMEERHIKAVQLLDDRSFTRFSAMLDAAQRIVSYEDLDAIVTDAHNRFEGRKVWDEARKQIRAHISDLVQAEKIKRQESQNAIETEGQPDSEPDWISDGQPVERPGSGSAADRINEAGEGQATPEGGGGSQEEFSLVAQSEDDVRAQEEARKESEAKAQKEEARLNLEKEEADARAEIRRRSEAAADTFQLGQDAMDNLSGQGGLFDALPADQPRAEPVTAPADAEASQSPKDQGAAAFKSGAERKAPEGLSIADKARWLGGYDDAKAEADQNPIKNETPEESTPLADNEAQNQNPIKNEAAVSVQSTTIESRGATWRIDVHPSAWVPGEMAWSGYKRNAGGEFVKVESDDIPAGVAKKAAEFFDSVVNPASDLLDQAGDAAVDAGPAAKLPQKGDRFTDGNGNTWEIWNARTSLIEAHPVVDGRPVVNRDSGQRFATDDRAKLANPEARTDYYPIDNAGAPAAVDAGNQAETGVKREEAKSPIDLLGDPPTLDYRTSRQASNSIKILPPVGKRFSDQDLQSLLDWVKAAGFAAWKKDSGLYVVGDNAPDIPDGLEVRRIEKKAKADAERESKAKAEADARDAEYRALPASVWIESVLGGDEFANAYNKLMLARFLDDKDSFKGLSSRGWFAPLARLGFPQDMNTSSVAMADVLLFLKQKYEDSKALPKREELQARIESAEQQTNHDATPAQKEAGNYAKGKFAWNGLTVSVETAKGEDRTDKETNGDKWRVTMPATYGYILGTKGADKDHVDLFMGDNPESELVFVVNQNRVDSQKFDEHKVMAGFASAKDAQAAYMASFEDGFGDRVFGSITGPYSIKDFREMLDAGKFEKPQSIGEPISPLSMIDVQLDGETMSAEQAIKDIDDQLSLADKLLNCVTK